MLRGCRVRLDFSSPFTRDSFFRRKYQKPPRWGRFWWRIKSRFGQVVFHHFGWYVQAWYYPDDINKPSFLDEWGEGEWAALQPILKGIIVPKFLRRLEGGPSANGKVEAFADAAWEKAFPATYEWMTQTTFPDGETRETTTLFLFVEGGQVKACINDRSSRGVLWAGESSLKELWEAVEALLRDSKAPWRFKAEEKRPVGRKGK